jgi:hypothetical protein
MGGKWDLLRTREVDGDQRSRKERDRETSDVACAVQLSPCKCYGLDEGVTRHGRWSGLERGEMYVSYELCAVLEEDEE